MIVHFIGAGPGAADLITVRGRDLIAQCPVCLYAGSIVPKELLQYCPPGARIVDTAPLSLDAIMAEIEAAATRAREDLRKQVSALAVSGAEKLLKREIDANAHKALLDELAAKEAFGRAADVWEVAATIAMLASDYTTYLTGEVVSISSQRA